MRLSCLLLLSLTGILGQSALEENIAKTSEAVIFESERGPLANPDEDEDDDGLEDEEEKRRGRLRKRVKNKGKRDVSGIEDIDFGFIGEKSVKPASLQEKELRVKRQTKKKQLKEKKQPAARKQLREKKQQEKKQKQQEQQPIDGKVLGRTKRKTRGRFKKMKNGGKKQRQIKNGK